MQYDGLRSLLFLFPMIRMLTIINDDNDVQDNSNDNKKCKRMQKLPLKTPLYIRISVQWESDLGQHRLLLLRRMLQLKS